MLPRRHGHHRRLSGQSRSHPPSGEAEQRQGDGTEDRGLGQLQAPEVRGRLVDGVDEAVVQGREMAGAAGADLAGVIGYVDACTVRRRCIRRPMEPSTKK